MMMPRDRETLCELRDNFFAAALVLTAVLLGAASIPLTLTKDPLILEISTGAPSTPFFQPGAFNAISVQLEGGADDIPYGTTGGVPYLGRQNPPASINGATGPCIQSNATVSLCQSDPPSAVPRRDGNYGYPTHAEVDYWRTTVGLTIVRVDFAFERLMADHTGGWRAAPTQAGGGCTHDPCMRDIDILDDLVAYANSKGLAVLLDNHFWNYIWQGLVSQSNPQGVTDFVNAWAQLAAHYKNANVWFGLMNEPYLMQNGDWATTVNQTIAAIRAQGANQTIMVPSCCNLMWGHDIQPFVATDPANNWVLGVHEYTSVNYDCVPAGFDAVADMESDPNLSGGLTVWARNNNVKLWMDESNFCNDNGESLAKGKALLSHLKANSDVWVGYNFWSAGPRHWAWSSTNAPSSIIEPNPEAGTPGALPDHDIVPLLKQYTTASEAPGFKLGIFLTGPEGDSGSTYTNLGYLPSPLSNQAVWTLRSNQVCADGYGACNPQPGTGDYGYPFNEEIDYWAAKGAKIISIEITAARVLS